MASSSTDQKDPTLASDLQNLDNLLNSVEQLELHYQKGIDNQTGDEEINNYEKLFAYQTEFWNSHISCIDSCNQNFLEMHKANAEHEKACNCFKSIWNFCCMANLHHRNIMRSWPASDLESRKLTILLAICDIEKFRCNKCTCDTQLDEISSVRN